MNNLKTKRFMVRCTPEEYRKFLKVSEIDGRNLSAEVRFFLNERAHALGVQVEPIYHPQQGKLME